jgi:hypothetical protein
MAQIKEIGGKKYIEQLQSIDGLELNVEDNIYRFAKKKTEVMNDYLEGYATATIDRIIGLYYCVEILDIEQFLEFDICQCFRGA